MAKVFDPYHVWLGIPSGDRPINHYRLLGIEVFEDDPEVIDSAAERQMAHLRTFQGGSHSSLSQQLLNEVAAARVCLLRPEKKAVYDEQLRGRLSPKVAVPAASQVEASASEAAGATTWEYLEQILPATSASRAARPTVSRLNQVAAVAVVATIALLLAITWLVVGKKTTPAPARPADAPVATGEVAKPKPLASERPAVAAPVETASAAQGKPSSAAVEPPAAKDVMAKNNAPENQLPKTEPVRAEPPKSETAARTVPKTAAVEARVLSFHLQPRQQVMGPLVNYSRPVRLQLSEKPPQPLKAEPKYRSAKPLYGTLRLGERPDDGTTVVLDEAENETPRIYIDRNNDKDLTNDGDGSWERVSHDVCSSSNVILPVSYASGSIPYTINIYRFRNRNRDYLLYFRNAGREGEVELDGKRYKFALLDENSTARFDDLQHCTLIIDLNQDGRLDGSSDSAESYPADKPINVNGKVWEVASISPDGLTIALRPSSQWIEPKAYLDAGYPAPAFVGSDLDHKPVDIKVEAAHSKYVLLDFWASWCGPCRGEFPNLRRANASYKERGLRIIGVNLDEQRDAALVAVRDAKLEYPQVFDGKGWQNAVAVQYRIHSIPQMFLLDENLKIVAKGLRGTGLEDRLRELLGAGGEPSAAPPSSSAARKAAPSPEAVAAAQAKIKNVFDENQQAGASQRLARVAQLIQRSRESNDDVEQYASLTAALELASQEGDCPLAVLAIDDLAKRFVVDGRSLKLELYGKLTKHLRGPTAHWTVESAIAMERELFGSEQFDGLATLLRQIDLSAVKKSLPEYLAPLQQERKRLDALRTLSEGFRTAAAARVKNPADPQAAAELGRMYGLVLEDWHQALPLLAQGDDASLASAAATLAAKPDDAAGQLALADAWWDWHGAGQSVLLRTLSRQAAAYWYEKAIPQLDGTGLVRARRRTSDESPRRKPAAKAGALGIALNGLGGLNFMRPSAGSGQQHIAANGGFADFHGRATIDYPQVAASCYVQDIQFTLSGAQDPSCHLDFRYGDPDDYFRIAIAWDSEKRQFLCRRNHGWSGLFYFSDGCPIPTGKPVHITLYVNDGRAWLFVDNAQAGTEDVAPADLRLHITTGNGGSLSIARCEFRPWQPADTQRLGYLLASRNIARNAGEAALRLHLRNKDLGQQPQLSSGKAYLVGTTGTAMQWISSGSFARRSGIANREPTQVEISHGFWLSRDVITQAEWMTLMPGNPSRLVGSPYLPVECVTWQDAEAWCGALTQLETKARRIPPNYEYRLPTDAEWEYAAAADSGVGVDSGWCQNNSDWHLHEVGEGQPNQWGLYDMFGNISQWCLDSWHAPADNPVSRLRDPFYRNPKSDSSFVVRGRAWWSSRGTPTPERAAHCVPGGHRGFRVALAPVQQ